MAELKAEAAALADEVGLLRRTEERHRDALRREFEDKHRVAVREHELEMGTRIKVGTARRLGAGCGKSPHYGQDVTQGCNSIRAGEDLRLD